MAISNCRKRGVNNIAAAGAQRAKIQHKEVPPVHLASFAPRHSSIGGADCPEEISQCGRVRLRVRSIWVSPHGEGNPACGFATQGPRIQDRVRPNATTDRIHEIKPCPTSKVGGSGRSSRPSLL